MSAAFTSVANRWVCSSLTETFTEIQVLMPAECHCASCSAARLTAQTARSWVSPDSVAAGMNSPGLTWPSRGWCQRRSASAPTMVRSLGANTGW